MIPREYNFDATELVIIDRQIEKFLQTGVIEKTTIVKESIFQIYSFGQRKMAHIA